MDIDDAFEPANMSELIQQKIEENQLAYEERIVKKIMTTGGVANKIGRLGMRAKEATGHGKILFTWLMDEYPSFPVFLVPRRLGLIYQAGVKHLFNNFDKLPTMNEWALIKAEADPAMPLGLVFDWAGVKGTQMVMHNWTTPIELDDGNLRIVKRVGQGKHAEMVYIEQFSSFMSYVLNAWVRE